MDLTISASFVAWYGATLSSLSMALGLYVALRDRPRIRVVARPGYRVVGAGSGYDSTKLYISISIANLGRRPVSIGNVGLLRKTKGEGQYLVGDSVRSGPVELTEGKATSYLVDQEGIDLDDIAKVIAHDQTGRSWSGRLRRD